MYKINIRVFGTKVGGGGGVDFGQARDCKGVPSTCMTWGLVLTPAVYVILRELEMVHLIQIGTPIVVFPTKG